MRKSKLLIEKATKEYIAAIENILPEASFAVAPEAFDGFDVWVHIFVPKSAFASDEQEARLRSAKAELSLRIADQTGVNITSTIEDQEIHLPSATSGGQR